MLGLESSLQTFFQPPPNTFMSIWTVSNDSFPRDMTSGAWHPYQAFWEGYRFSLCCSSIQITRQDLLRQLIYLLPDETGSHKAMEGRVRQACKQARRGKVFFKKSGDLSQRGTPEVIMLKESITSHWSHYLGIYTSLFWQGNRK